MFVSSTIFQIDVAIFFFLPHAHLLSMPTFFPNWECELCCEGMCDLTWTVWRIFLNHVVGENCGLSGFTIQSVNYDAIGSAEPSL